MGADADYLRETLGIRNVMKPKIASTDGIIEAMKEICIYQGDALVLVPEVLPPLTEPDVVPNFLQNLKTLGINPRRIPAYETAVGPSLREVEPEVKMLMEGSVRAIAFTSTAESEGLCHIIGKDKLLECIAAHHIVIAAHGLTTASGVAKVLNYSGKVRVSRDSSSFEGIVAAIADNI
jgi:uroporphyrinogen-III synthase